MMEDDGGIIVGQVGSVRIHNNMVRTRMHCFPKSIPVSYVIINAEDEWNSMRSFYPCQGKKSVDKTMLKQELKISRRVVKNGAEENSS